MDPNALKSDGKRLKPAETHADATTNGRETSERAARFREPRERERETEEQYAAKHPVRAHAVPLESIHWQPPGDIVQRPAVDACEVVAVWVQR